MATIMAATALKLRRQKIKFEENASPLSPIDIRAIVFPAQIKRSSSEDANASGCIGLERGDGKTD
eukprot:scaffold9437_cov31-Attheya_sp.AAC.1